MKSKKAMRKLSVKTRGDRLHTCRNQKAPQNLYLCPSHELVSLDREKSTPPQIHTITDLLEIGQVFPWSSFCVTQSDSAREKSLNKIWGKGKQIMNLEKVLCMHDTTFDRYLWNIADNGIRHISFSSLCYDAF